MHDARAVYIGQILKHLLHDHLHRGRGETVDGAAVADAWSSMSPARALAVLGVYRTRAYGEVSCPACVIYAWMQGCLLVWRAGVVCLRSGDCVCRGMGK